MRTVADRYALLERVGSGAMGVVWRARDGLLEREVAIKQLLLPDLPPRQVEEACLRAMREGRIAARSGPLTPLLTRLLAIKPADRLTAAEVAGQLAALTGTGSRRTGVLVGAAAAVVFAAAVVTTTHVLDRDRTSPGPAAASTGQSTTQQASALTTADVDAFVKQHFAKLPHDPAGAREDRASEFRPASGATTGSGTTTRSSRSTANPWSAAPRRTSATPSRPT